MIFFTPYWVSGTIRKSNFLLCKARKYYGFVIQNLKLEYKIVEEIEVGEIDKLPTPLVASNKVFARYPFVPLTQHGVKKIMKMTVFLFSKFLHLRFLFWP